MRKELEVLKTFKIRKVSNLGHAMEKRKISSTSWHSSREMSGKSKPGRWEMA